MKVLILILFSFCMVEFRAFSVFRILIILPMIALTFLTFLLVRLGWAEDVTRMEESRSAFKILIGKPIGRNTGLILLRVGITGEIRVL